MESRAARTIDEGSSATTRAASRSKAAKVPLDNLASTRMVASLLARMFKAPHAIDADFFPPDPN